VGFLRAASVSDPIPGRLRLPLGLELAATWLWAMSCPQIAAQIETNFPAILLWEVHFFAPFVDISRAIIYAGSQYSATLDPNGFYILTGVLSGTYEIRGEIPNNDPCEFYAFEPFSQSVQVPPSAARQDFEVFRGVIDPGPVQGTAIYRLLSTPNN